MTDSGGLHLPRRSRSLFKGQRCTNAVADNANAVEAGGVSNGTAGTNPTGNVLTNDTDPDSSGNGETKTVSGVVAGTAGSAVGSVASIVTVPMDRSTSPPMARIPTRLKQQRHRASPSDQCPNDPGCIYLHDDRCGRSD